MTMDNMQNINVCENILVLPGDFVALKSLPGDPDSASVFGRKTEGTVCCLLLYPVEKNKGDAL